MEVVICFVLSVEQKCQMLLNSVLNVELNCLKKNETESNTEVISGASDSGSDNGALSNEVVAKAVEHDDESAIPQIVLPKFDFDAMMNEEFSRVVDSPITKVEKAAKNVLNDVDITDVMLNPKKEIAKFGFNVFKEIFGKNNPP